MKRIIAIMCLLSIASTSFAKDDFSHEEWAAYLKRNDEFMSPLINKVHSLHGDEGCEDITFAQVRNEYTFGIGKDVGDYLLSQWLYEDTQMTEDTIKLSHTRNGGFSIYPLRTIKVTVKKDSAGNLVSVKYSRRFQEDLLTLPEYLTKDCHR